MSNGYSVDDIAPPSGDYWQPEVNDKVAGLITYLDTYRRENNWGKTEENLRIDLEQTDGSSIIVTVVTNADCLGDGYAKRDAKAVAAAVRAAGASRLEVGGRLGMVRRPDVATKMGVGRDYAAEYKAPAVGVPVATVDPAPAAPPATTGIAGLAGQLGATEVPAAQPAPAPVVTEAAPAAQPAPAPVVTEAAPAAEPGAVTGLI